MTTSQPYIDPATESTTEHRMVSAAESAMVENNSPVGWLETRSDGIKKAAPFLPFGVITVAALLVAYYYYSEAGRLRENPQIVAQNEVAQVVTRVGELIILPESEQPTVATVTDPERLREQPFFAKAKVGDRVLIYTNARKAILYDPEQHKIIEVAPLNIGNTGQ